MKRQALGAAIAIVLASSGLARAHGTTMNVGSTTTGTGSLAIEYDFDQRTVVTPSVDIGGFTLWSSLFPSFAWVGPAEPSTTLFALNDHTPVTLTLTAIDPGLSVRVNGTPLDAVGEAALVGSSSGDAGSHVHPEWQVLLPQGADGELSLSFRLTTTAKAYSASPVYSLTFTTVQESSSPTPAPQTATPSPEPTPSPSAAEATATSTRRPVPSNTSTRTPTGTPTPSATPTSIASLAGDANCDGAVTAADLIATIVAIESGGGVCGSDANGDGVWNERDLDRIRSSFFVSRSSSGI